MSFNEDPRFSKNQTPTPETQKKRPGDVQELPEIDRNYSDILSAENKSFFNKISEGAKNIANQAYENIYKVPGVNKIVGKLEAGYNQLWANRHEKKAVKFKDKMDKLDLQIGVKKYREEKIDSAIRDLQKRGHFGGDPQLKLQKLNKEKFALENKKDKVQSKLESRDNKVSLYINKRDTIADRLINHYEEKLKPMEEELEKLQSLKDQAELSVAVEEVKYKEQIKKLKEEEKEKLEIEEKLKEGGLSEKEIKKATKEIEDSIAEGHLVIKRGRLEFAQEREKLNKKIAKADAKANPYRDKREEFNRIKQKRPLNIEAEARERSKNVHYEEKIEAHTRKDAPEIYVEPSSTTSDQTSIESSTDFGTPPIQEIQEEEIMKLEIPIYINSWNNYLEEYGGDDFSVFVDGDDFLNKTGFSKNKTLEFLDFKNILKKYYKVKKLPVEKMNKFDKKIDDYFKKNFKN